jgi:hypothetical protein
MTAKKLDDQQIQSRIDVLDALAQSGQSAKAFAQTQGISYAQLRGWQAHGARWRAQQAAKLPSPEPLQVQSHVQAPLALVAKPTMACDFIQAQVTPERLNPEGRCSSSNGHASKSPVLTGVAIAPTTPAVWVGAPPVEEHASMPAAQSMRPAYAHDPPTPSQVQILCTQGLRSALVHWPSTAPLECAQWIRAYLA